MPAMCRDLQFLPSLVGHECVRSPSLLLSHKRFRWRNHLRQKTNFSRAFNSMTPVQISRKKYSVLCSPQISGFISLSRLVQGAFRDRHGRGGGERWPREIAAFFSRMRTNDRFADGQAVWSWRPDAGAKLAKTLHASCGRRGKRARSPGRARSKPLKPLRREGRVSSAEPVVLPRAFFTARGPWAPAGARSSLRPLTFGGFRFGKARAPSARRECEALAV
jgi:hypothetical protein